MQIVFSEAAAQKLKSAIGGGEHIKTLEQARWQVDNFYNNVCQLDRDIRNGIESLKKSIYEIEQTRSRLEAAKSDAKSRMSSEDPETAAAAKKEYEQISDELDDVPSTDEMEDCLDQLRNCVMDVNTLRSELSMLSTSVHSAYDSCKSTAGHVVQQIEGLLRCMGAYLSVTI